MAQDTFYDINLSKLIHDNLPDDKRTGENKSALQGFMAGFSRSHQSFLDFKRGADIFSFVQIWTPFTWNLGERCIYFNSGEVYECVVTSTVAEPTTSTDWVKVADSFIGNDELMQFNGTKLSLEYALNRRFYTIYNNPPVISDIYITTITSNPLAFVIGADHTNSSSIYSNTSSEFIGILNSFDTIDDFTINVPTSLMTTLGVDAEKIIRNFVDKFVTFGIKFLINPY